MITYESPVEEVITWTKTQEWPTGTVIEQVGNWTWIEFKSGKPAAEIRAKLKEAGFRWIDVRQKWAHMGGHKTYGKSKGDPRDTYGVQYKKEEA